MHKIPPGGGGGGFGGEGGGKRGSMAGPRSIIICTCGQPRTYIGSKGQRRRPRSANASAHITSGPPLSTYTITKFYGISIRETAQRDI